MKTQHLKLISASVMVFITTSCTKIIIQKPLKPTYTCKPAFVPPELKHIDGTEALVSNYRNLLEYTALQHKLLDNTILCYENIVEAVTEQK
jgi:hypothetical protein